MHIETTSIEDLVVCLEDGDEVLSGYTIIGGLEDGRSLLLADVAADTHPAMDVADDETVGAPSLAEAQAIAHLLAAAPALKRMVMTLALTALSNDGYVGLEQTQQAIDAVQSMTSINDNFEDD